MEPREMYCSLQFASWYTGNNDTECFQKWLRVCASNIYMRPEIKDNNPPGSVEYANFMLSEIDEGENFLR
jgi:hypothetical protein